MVYYSSRWNVRGSFKNVDDVNGQTPERVYRNL